MNIHGSTKEKHHTKRAPYSKRPKTAWVRRVGRDYIHRVGTDYKRDVSTRRNKGTEYCLLHGKGVTLTAATRVSKV